MWSNSIFIALTSFILTVGEEKQQEFTGPSDLDVYLFRDALILNIVSLNSSNSTFFLVLVKI